MRRSDASAKLAAAMGVSPTEMGNYRRVLRENKEFANSLPGRAPNPVSETDLMNLLIGYCATRAAVNAPDALRKVRKFTRTLWDIDDPENRPLPAFVREKSFAAALSGAIWAQYEGKLSQWLQHSKGQAVGFFRVEFDQEAAGARMIAERWRPGAKRDELVARFVLLYGTDDDKKLKEGFSASRAVDQLTLSKIGELVIEGAE